MPKVTFIEADGSQTIIQGKIGHTLMETARDNNVQGIVAECGGAAMCATCHVFVVESFWPVTGERKEIEEDMLDMSSVERRPDSRLSCQIELTEEMDGLIVHLPESQT